MGFGGHGDGGEASKVQNLKTCQCSCSKTWLFDIGDEMLPNYMDVSKNRGTPKSSILIGFSVIFTIHLGGFPTILGNTHDNPYQP